VGKNEQMGVVSNLLLYIFYNFLFLNPANYITSEYFFLKSPFILQPHFIPDLFFMWKRKHPRKRIVVTSKTTSENRSYTLNK
jgi:hypothetical protein